ncbi:unnamed protein product [Calypogeia fissa]
MGDIDCETFIEHLKNKSCARIADHLQILEEPQKDDMNIAKGLDLIQKLDMQLKEVEERQKNANPSTATNSPAPSTPNKSSEHAENALRYEKKQRLKASKLRRILESVDQNQPENWTGFILRNIKLGPNSRYFMLKPEEEAVVERLLQQPDLEDENGSVSSSQYDSGFEMSEEDSQRLAEIDDKLLQYQSRQEKSGPYTMSCTSSDVDTPKVESSSTTTPIPSNHTRLCCKTVAAQDNMASVVADYLNERRHCRQYQLQSEAIDKKLRDLQVSDLPKVTHEQITVLLNQCRYEQGILSCPLAGH